MKTIRSDNKRKWTLDEISKYYKIGDYGILVNFIMENIEKENIRPISN